MHCVESVGAGACFALVVVEVLVVEMLYCRKLEGPRCGGIFSGIRQEKEATKRTMCSSSQILTWQPDMVRLLFGQCQVFICKVKQNDAAHVDSPLLFSAAPRPSSQEVCDDAAAPALNATSKEQVRSVPRFQHLASETS